VAATADGATRAPCRARSPSFFEYAAASSGSAPGTGSPRRHTTAAGTLAQLERRRLEALPPRGVERRRDLDRAVPVEGGVAGAARTSTGPSSVETKASGSPGYSVTAAAKKRARSRGRAAHEDEAEALADARRPRSRRSQLGQHLARGGGGDDRELGGRGGEHQGGLAANVTALASGEGRKPALITTRSPTRPAAGSPRRRAAAPM